MKIIHGRDYYDFDHAGIDETVTFERDEKIDDILEEECPLRLEVISQSARFLGLYNSLASEDGDLFIFEPIFVFVAGAVYPALRFVHEDVDVNREYLERLTLYDAGNSALHEEKSEIIYDIDRANEMISKVDHKKARSFAFSKGKRTLEQIVHDHFATAPDAYAEYLIENSIVTGFAFKRENNFGIGNSSIVVHQNIDYLKELQFIKVMDGFTLNQEIFRFISGVLPTPGASTVEIEDKYRIRKGGFDPKYGFRTRPSK
jgi:hypothetical protein